jgi:hypothetical protein
MTVLDADQARQLLDSIDVRPVVGLRSLRMCADGTAAPR